MLCEDYLGWPPGDGLGLVIGIKTFGLEPYSLQTVYLNGTFTRPQRLFAKGNSVGTVEETPWGKKHAASLLAEMGGVF